jgi:nitroreductase/catechol 2,3-dioxygenase-like lactoylglutathione lyase family enzyme
MNFVFDHNNINVFDLEKSLTFYREALGLRVSREVNAPDGSFRILFLSDVSGAHALELTWLRDRTTPYNLGDNEYHMAVRCADKEAAYALHKKMDCICYENNEMGLYFIADPDGYWIEILGPKVATSAVRTLLNRRSVRSFSGEPVPPVLVEGILRAAMQAPSAGNQQPWRFVVVRDKNILKEVPSVHPYAAMVPECDVAILVCGDTRAEKYPGYWTQDCSAAVENMLIAIQSFGLGGVWLGVYPTEDRVVGMRKLFHISEETVIPFALVPVGFSKHPHAEVTQRFDADRVSLDVWNRPYL